MGKFSLIEMYRLYISMSVSNGVRQGGILSPFLFNIYMDDLSVNLKECPTGCIAGGTIVNHLMYADDIVLLSPSATGHSLLLKVCGKYGLEHDIRFNSKKSAVIFKMARYRTEDGREVKRGAVIKYNNGRLITESRNC